MVTKWGCRTLGLAARRRRQQYPILRRTNGHHFGGNDDDAADDDGGVRAEENATPLLSVRPTECDQIFIPVLQGAWKYYWNAELPIIQDIDRFT